MRDRSLDFLKGVACLMMILAHAPVQIPPSWGLCFFIANMAPAVFFPITGITTLYQIKKRNLKVLFCFYAIFFVLGFSYNALWHTFYFTRDLVSDILQIVAIAVLIIAVFEKAGFKDYSYMFLVPLLLHLLLTNTVTSNFFLREFIMPPGVFTLLPWLGFFLYGVYMYKHSLLANIINTIILLLLLILYNGKFFSSDKWNMDASYFFASLFLFSMLFIVTRGLKNVEVPIINYFGRNSLMFLYTHILFMRKYVRYFKLSQASLTFFIISIIGVYVFMLIATRLNEFTLARLSNNVAFWAILLVNVIILPFATKNVEIIVNISYIIGIIFALNYHNLMKLIETKLQWFSKSDKMDVV
ncbi:hypothetical protein SAMN02746089_00813 [Caldanaerobius fijiensis DSM 17918]|uniref:Fucose 4-O-acetylase n=1 Tax=Caldanaerobius fijiensis DSM 17918 TaxID=1121256 RepID=A0A1M4WI91_9THEO|nr:hypothetical protein [Caldanaerobius fijiensis]SHE80692.1 hypothetical protein SAMN02746089_00813 [Caldanaerobius fijiensis DSM 17918]